MPSSASHRTLRASHHLIASCFPACFVSQQILQDIDPCSGRCSEELKQQQLKFPQGIGKVAGPAAQFNLGAGKGLVGAHRVWDGIIPAASVLGMSSTDLPHPRQHIVMLQQGQVSLTEQTAAFVIAIPQPLGRVNPGVSLHEYSLQHLHLL